MDEPWNVLRSRANASVGGSSRKVKVTRGGSASACCRSFSFRMEILIGARTTANASHDCDVRVLLLGGSAADDVMRSLICDFDRVCDDDVSICRSSDNVTSRPSRGRL